jgi:hypothetical protein
MELCALRTAEELEGVPLPERGMVGIRVKSGHKVMVLPNQRAVAAVKDLDA